MRALTLAALWILALSAAVPAADNRAVADAAFDELTALDFASLAERFSPEMSGAMPSEKLPAAVGPVLKSLGPLRSGRPEPQMTSRKGFDVFVYPTEFEKAKLTVVITVNSAGQVAGLFLRPPLPEPVKPDELAVTSGSIRLPATLVVPEGEGPFPAVVLVHGSGPGDQDETVGANAPFRDLAEGLANHGVASLRYVKRTRQYPQNPIATVEDEVIEDVLNAVALVRSQPRIDPKRVYVLGHSMGAYLAPRIAASEATIAGIVMLAGNARPVLELARDQLEYLNAPPDRLERLKASAPASYWEDLKSYDPVQTARQLKMPVLILQGERDYQVTMKEFELWKSGLQGCENVTFKSYSKLNHLFLEGQGKSLPSEYDRPGNIPDYVYADIADFTQGVSGNGPRMGRYGAGEASSPAPAAEEAGPAFKTATIRPNTSGRANQRIQTTQSLRVNNVSLKTLIKFAYRLNDRQIEGGPSWLDVDRFDILAQPATQREPGPAQWLTMIRKLLAERFNLTLHTEERMLQAYTLGVDASGPKMAKADPNGPGDPDFNGLGTMQAKAMNMEDLAFVLGSVVLDRPVLDRTGLAGRYAFSLVWAPGSSQFPGVRQRPSPKAFAGRDDLFTAMRQQLGLRLEATEAPVKILVIEKATKPLEN